MDPDAHQTELVERAAAGNTAALTVLLALVKDSLCKRLHRKMPRDLQGVIAVDDIWQEAQVAAFLHIGQFQPEHPDSFERWVATIALRHLHNAIRKQKAQKRGGGRAVVQMDAGVPHGSAVALLDLMSAPTDTPSRVAAGREAIRAVQDALEQLPHDYSTAVRLVYLEGRSVAEAAEIMGRTDRAIHNLCYKAKRLLKEIMGSGSRFLSRHG